MNYECFEIRELNKEVMSDKKNLISIQLLNEEKFSRQNFSTLIEFS